MACQPPAHPRWHRLCRRVALLVVTGCLVAPTALADSADLTRVLETTPNRDWRPQGLAYVDLPFRIRARFESSYQPYSTVSDLLAAPFVTSTGPQLVRQHLIETRIALTRPLSERVELEITWHARNRIARGEAMRFRRHVVGAMIRFTP